jgi:hypothetical protein
LADTGRHIATLGISRIVTGRLDKNDNDNTDPIITPVLEALLLVAGVVDNGDCLFSLLLLLLLLMVSVTVIIIVYSFLRRIRSSSCYAHIMSVM